MMTWLRSLLGSKRSAGASRYRSAPSWGQRRFEAAETDRLNEAHWLHATDNHVNEWLRERLSILRARCVYETRHNGMLSGVVGTLVDDVVGPDGPVLQVLSDDNTYNDALEQLWRTWFAAPTFRPTFSGTQLLKLWVRNLPRCGEFLATIETDRDAEGPVQLRLKPRHPRLLGTPYDRAGDVRHEMGIDFDEPDGRPVRYWIGSRQFGGLTTYAPYPPDLVIHEFLVEEEGQARGIPWSTPSLPSAADLRDYDDQVQDAARQMADAAAMLYTENPDVPVWDAPEETEIQRRTVRMAPPGWKPWQYNASQPPAQYPDYRAERHRELGRPFGMPLLMVRLDSSRHNYSSARLDTQTYNRTVQGIQRWLSGTEASCGTLNRLVDLIAAEARFTLPALRRRPERVLYHWTWTPRPHVDPAKEATAEETGLRNRTLSFSDALAARGTNLDTHLEQLARVEAAFAELGLSLPAWLTGAPSAASSPATEKDDDEEDKTKANIAESSNA